MINKVILLGNVGQDPEVRTLETGVKVARLRLATTERIFNRQTNDNTEHTEWHSITLWRLLYNIFSSQKTCGIRKEHICKLLTSKSESFSMKAL